MLARHPLPIALSTTHPYPSTPPPAVSLSPHIIVASQRFWLCMSLSALLSLSRCRSVALVVAVVNFIYHLTFFTVFMLPKGVVQAEGWGEGGYSQRHTLSDFWSTLFCIQNICLVDECVCVCVWVGGCVCVCVRTACVSACAHLICLITLGCLIGAAFILLSRFIYHEPATFGIYHV